MHPPHWVPATVIYSEITQYGYDGCYSLLTAYMYSLKVKNEEPIIRFEQSLAIKCKLIGQKCARARIN